jgi:SAM-dependent methyltransferase
MSYYREQLEDWLKTLDIKAETVFDIGGEQGQVKNRLKSWDVKNYKVLDLPFFDITRLSNARDIARTEQADVIFCLEVFEYLIRPYEAMESIYLLLKDGGKAYVTFAFVYPHHNEIELDSLRYTEPGINRLAKEIGLNITDIHYRVDQSGYLEQFYRHDGMRAAKQYNHHDATGFIVEFTK